MHEFLRFVRRIFIPCSRQEKGSAAKWGEERKGDGQELFDAKIAPARVHTVSVEKTIRTDRNMATRSRR